MLRTVKEYVINRSLRKSEEKLLKTLNQYAKNYCRKNFRIDFKCFIMFSDEENLIGKFVSYFDIPVYVAIGRAFYYNAEIDELIQVLNHELIHYSLCKLGLPYADDDDYFIRTCELLNVPTEYNRGDYWNENENDTMY